MYQQRPEYLGRVYKQAAVAKRPALKRFAQKAFKIWSFREGGL